jgi:hypothetical protein
LRSREFLEQDPNRCHPRGDTDRRGELAAKIPSPHRESLSLRGHSGSRWGQIDIPAAADEEVVGRDEFRFATNLQPDSCWTHFSNTTQEIGDVLAHLRVCDGSSGPVATNEEATGGKLSV